MVNVRIIKFLIFRLCLPHHTFWSYVVYDVELAKKLTRLLTMLPRQHDRFTPHPGKNQVIFQMKLMVLVEK